MTYSSRGGKVFFGLFLTFLRSRAIICGQAGVLELADEEDSKSFGLITRAGSTPATGTNKGATPAWGRALVATDCSRSTRRIPCRLRHGIPSCRHPIRLPFSLFRAAAAGSGACAASTPAHYGFVLRSTRTIAPASVFPLALSHNFPVRFCTFRRFHRGPSLFPCKKSCAVLKLLNERMKTVHPK